MSGPESKVWAQFSKTWPYHCERLEPAFDSGLPDVLLQDIHGRAGFAELKAADKVVLKPSQRSWILRWQDKGSAAIPVVTCENHNGKIEWQVYRCTGGGYRLSAALLKDKGRWIKREEMINIVLIMNGLEPYFV